MSKSPDEPQPLPHLPGYGPNDPATLDTPSPAKPANRHATAAAQPPDGESRDTLAGRLENRCFKHGLRARNLTVCPEDRMFYEHFRQSQLESFAPDEGPERFFCEQIVAHQWFLWQCDTAEAAAMRKSMEAAQRTRMGTDEDRVFKPQRPQSDAELHDHVLTAAAANKDVQLITRYRTSHERGMERMQKALRQYQGLRDARDARIERQLDADHDKVCRDHDRARCNPKSFAWEPAVRDQARPARSITDPRPSSPAARPSHLTKTDNSPDPASRPRPEDIQTDFRATPTVPPGALSILLALAACLHVSGPRNPAPAFRAPAPPPCPLAASIAPQLWPTHVVPPNPRSYSPQSDIQTNFRIRAHSFERSHMIRIPCRHEIDRRPASRHLRRRTAGGARRAGPRR